MKRSGIYKITNIITGCVYIGSSKDLDKRLVHYTKIVLDKISKDIKNSIITYGIENHEIRILCEFDSEIPKKELETYEDGFILINLDRLGEENILNFYCNDRKKWCSKRYKDFISRTNSGINNYHYKKYGIQHHCSKKVNQYSFDNIFIKTWNGLRDIERELCINHSNISRVCNGKGKSAGGFKWSYNEKEG